MKKLFLVLGLGNPGHKYIKTRHNLGFIVVKKLSWKFKISLNRSSHYSRWGKGFYKNHNIILALPQTYMNLSGQAVQSLLTSFNISPQALLVIHDDLDQQPGQIKIVLKGGAGGHKGVNSILQILNNNHILRIKLGIGRPRFGETIENFVLSSIYSDQHLIISQAIQQAINYLETIFTIGMSKAMHHFHYR